MVARRSNKTQKSVMEGHEDHNFAIDSIGSSANGVGKKAESERAMNAAVEVAGNERSQAQVILQQAQSVLQDWAEQTLSHAQRKVLYDMYVNLHGGLQGAPVQTIAGTYLAQNRLDNPDRLQNNVEDNNNRQNGTNRRTASARGIGPRKMRRCRQQLDYPCRRGVEHPVPIKKTHVFRICEEHKVKLYLNSRLSKLQQQANKRIAKAWIKGICPKKQARFPYQNKVKLQKEGKAPDVPKWWPIDECPFTEPDHIDRNQRMALNLYLLRLRPSTEQLRSWNKDLDEPNKVLEMPQFKVLETQGWTEFLKQCTSFSMLQGLGPSPEPQGKLEMLQKLMDDMYIVADMEEGYLRGERDGNDTFEYDTEAEESDEDVDDLPKASKKTEVPKKRSREGSILPSGDRGRSQAKRLRHHPYQNASAPSFKVLASRMSNIGITGSASPGIEDCIGQFPTAKETSESAPAGPWESYPVDGGRQAYQTNPHGSDRKIQKSQKMIVPMPASLRIPHPLGFVPELTSRHLGGGSEYANSSHTSSPVAASSSSVQSKQERFCDSYQTRDGWDAFPGWRNFDYQHHRPGQDMVQVHHVVGVPEPQFHTVTNTPVIPPSNTTHLCNPDVAAQMMLDQGTSNLSVGMPIAPYPALGSSQPNAPLATHVGEAQYTTNASMHGSHFQTMIPTVDYPPFPYDNCAAYYGGQPHGLPTTYHPFQQVPQIDPYMQFAYPECRPDDNFPANTLPGPEFRGFTGHGSGVGGGAWV